MISTRKQFVALFLATLVGIAFLAGYGVYALGQIAEGAHQTRADLDRLSTTAEVEDALRTLGASNGTSPERLAHLDGHVKRLRQLGVTAEDAGRLEELEARLSEARAAPSAERWLAAGRTAGAMEEALIERAQKREAQEDAEKRAHRLLRIGVALVALFATASIVIFVRWQRETRDTQDRLRRSDRLAALGTIAASVAHEINNPLATIAGCASAVRDRMRRRTDACADSLEYLEMIEDETRRCTGIVQSLRDLARDGPPATAPADLAKLARSMIHLLEVDRRAKPVRFEIEGDEQLEAICDPDKIKQLLLNLLLNARDASSSDGRVVVRLTRVGELARIEVADEGRGIERRDLTRIFEPFHTDKTQGLGIGLFLCERIAAMHGGTIHAESEGRGRGARFVVEFPTRTAGSVTAEALS